MSVGYGRGHYGGDQLEPRRGQPRLKIGDRVRLPESPAHAPEHYGRAATVAVVHPGPAYGLVIDGTESTRVHKWYVGDELTRSAEPQGGMPADPYGGAAIVGQEARFKIGDRVKLTEFPAHNPYHYGRNATVVKIEPGPLYGLLVDGMESMGTHKWYAADELAISDQPQKRTIAPVVLGPDLVMLGLGLAGIIGSNYIKSEATAMTTRMVAAMSGAVGLHGALMRLTEGAIKPAARGDASVFSDPSQKRTIGPVVLVSDLVMFGVGVAGVIGSRYIKSEGMSMTALMVGSMSGAVGLHGALTKLTQGGLKAEVNYPPPQASPKDTP